MCQKPENSDTDRTLLKQILKNEIDNGLWNPKVLRKLFSSETIIFTEELLVVSKQTYQIMSIKQSTFRSEHPEM